MRRFLSNQPFFQSRSASSDGTPDPVSRLSSLLLDADVFRRRCPQPVQHAIVATWYDCVSRWFGDESIRFLDVGWAELDPEAPVLPLAPEDETERNGAQLYHRVAGAVDLRGADVVEVGCGRGGGASYIARYLGPRSVTAIDISPEAIRFCERHHRVPALSFRRGTADLSAFEPGSVDAVVNVESSGAYPSMEHFLAGVHRVLRPGGHLLFADMRDAGKVNRLRRQLKRSGLVVVEEEDISRNAARALELDEPRKRALFDATVPALVRPFWNEFAAGTETNFTCRRLLNGERVFLRFVLRRPSRAGGTPR